jgi:hypothetical protein
MFILLYYGSVTKGNQIFYIYPRNAILVDIHLLQVITTKNNENDWS